MGGEVVYYNHKEQRNRPKAGKEMNMNTDVFIYLTQWGCCADEMRYVCESNINGMVHATFRTYQQAVDWCENKGYSHN